MAPGELLNLMESPDLLPFVWRIGETVREIEYLHRVSLLTVTGGNQARAAQETSMAPVSMIKKRLIQ